VLVVACSHPGIEAIVAEAAKIDPHIHFIAGGFHLVVAQDPAIEKVAVALHDTYKVDYIAPGHCTGEATFAALQQTFGDRYRYAGLGTTLGVGCESARRLGSERHLCAGRERFAQLSGAARPEATTRTTRGPKQSGSRRPSSGRVNGGALGAGSLAPRPRRP